MVSGAVGTSWKARREKTREKMGARPLCISYVEGLPFIYTGVQ